MIESITRPVPAPHFFDGLQSEFTTVQMGGVVTAVSYLNGQGTFNGSSSKIAYPVILGIKSVRIKLVSIATTTQHIMKLTATHSISVSGGTVAATGFSSPTIYVNGAAGSTITTGASDIVITTATAIDANALVLGFITGYLNGVVESWEAYKEVLSASEISNLFNNRRNVPLSPTTAKYPILDVSARRGFCENRLTGSTINGTLVPAVVVTDVAVMSKKMYGNGLTSSINAGTYSTFVSDVSLVFFGRLNNYGEGGVGRIFDNGKFKVYVTSTNNRIAVTSDGSTIVYSATNSIIAGVDYCIVVRRKADGKATVWVGTMKSPMALSGTADQASGTPAAGTTAITLLNDATGAYTLDGSMGWCYCVNGILSDTETENLRTANARLLI